MRNKARRDRGFAIMLVLIAVALAVVLGTSYVSSAAIKAAGTRNLLKASRARYVAESGMQHAMYLLWTDPSSVANRGPSNPLGPYSADNTTAQYRLWSVPDTDEIGLYHMTARATSEGLTQDVLWDVYRTPPYEQVMLSHEPNGYWRFTNGTPPTVVQDYGEGNYDLVCLNGAAMTGTSGVTSGGSALEVDGTNDFATRGPTRDLQLKTDLTISVWFNIDQLPTGTNKAVVVTCSEDSEFPTKNALYEIAVNSSGQIQFLQEYNWGRDQRHVFDTVTLSTGSWHNVVVTRDWAASTLSLYVEGQFVESWSFYNPGEPKPWQGRRAGIDVGSAWGEESFFDGKIDELGLMDHVLSDQEINTLYQVGGTPERIEVRSCVR